MAKDAEFRLKDSGEILRDLAAHQGLAYRQYGEALEKFGSGKINAGELFKTAGDLYFKEAGRVSSGLFEAAVSIFQGVLGGVGLRTIEEDAARDTHNAAALKQ
jgi:hypothetical protein